MLCDVLDGVSVVLKPTLLASLDVLLFEERRHRGIKESQVEPRQRIKTQTTEHSSKPPTVVLQKECGGWIGRGVKTRGCPQRGNGLTPDIFYSATYYIYTYKYTSYKNVRWKNGGG